MSITIEQTDAEILLQAAKSLLALRDNLPGGLLARAQAALRQVNLPDWTDPADQSALQTATMNITQLLGL